MDTLKTCIPNCKTLRIGNKDQGPGDIGCAIVYNYLINKNDIKKYYYETLNEITPQWNDNEINAIKNALLSYVGISGIVKVMMEYVRYRTFV